MRHLTLSLPVSALLVLGTLVLSAQQATPPPGGQEPMFRAGVAAVTTDVIARDKGGRFVSTLTKDDFTVLEDGVPQTITSFSLVYGGRTFTPYGATEALPVSSLSGDEILADTWPQTRAGAGVCVGRPFAELTVKILPISDEPIPDWDDARVLPAGTIGEIVVKGPVVTKRYDHHDRENIWAKIYEGSDVWHRMGDAGYFDDRGRLWFCGRKNHRVETAGGVLYSVPVEEIFNAHPRVFRAALVGLGSRPRQHPVLIVEPRPGAAPRGRAERAAFIDELKALAKNHSSLGEIRDILFHPGLPVDYRHNAKIIREELVPWAAKELGGR